MKPIQVHIENFQSIESLDFSIYGFTCITGKSNIGKSAIARAIYRCIMNETVKGAVRHGKKFVTVSLTSDWSIWWKKGEKGNEYEVNGKSYSNTGQKQLPEIADLGFRSVRVGDQDVTPWYANQYEPVFLLNKSGGQITEFISEISRLKVVQESIQRSITLKKKSTDKSNVHKEEISRLSKRVSSFIGIEEAVDLYKKLEEEKKATDGKKSTLSALTPLSTKIERTKEYVEVLSPVKSVSIEGTPGSYPKWESGSKALKRLEDLGSGLRSVEPVKSVAVDAKDFNVDLRVLEMSSTISLLRSKTMKPDVGVPKIENNTDFLERMETLYQSMKKLCIGAPPPVVSGSTVDVERLEKASALSHKIAEKRREVEGCSSEAEQVGNELAVVDIDLSSFVVCPFCDSKPTVTCVKERVGTPKFTDSTEVKQERKSLTLDDFDV